MSDNYGFIISKKGYDVKTADPENLVLHSDFFTNKILMEGEIEVDVDDELAEGWWKGQSVITHGLDYYPIHFCYAKLGSIATIQGYIGFRGGGITGVLRPRNGWSSNINKIFVEVQYTSGITAIVKFYVLYDEGEL